MRSYGLLELKPPVSLMRSSFGTWRTALTTFCANSSLTNIDQYAGLLLGSSMTGQTSRKNALDKPETVLTYCEPLGVLNTV